MRKTLVIAVREYVAAVRTRSFILGLLALPVMMGVIVALQWFMHDRVDITEKKFAVVDRTPSGRLAGALEEAAKGRNEREIYSESGRQNKPKFAIERVTPSAVTPEAIAEQRFALSERVRAKEIFAFIEIGKDVNSPLAADSLNESSGESDNPASAARVNGVPLVLPGEALARAAPDSQRLRYQSDSPTYDAFYNWAEPLLNRAIQAHRFEAAGIEEQRVHQVLTPVPLLTKQLSEKDAAGNIIDAVDQNRIAGMMVPMAIMALMYMLVMIGATPLLQGVIEEKLQRIAEVMLGSVSPFQLMMGKLLGMAAVSFTLSTIYLAAGWWTAREYQLDSFFSIELMAWFLVFQVLAILMYGSMFIAVGAACTDMRETQNMLWPVMMVAMLPMCIWFFVAREPTSTFSTMISYFPPATPMLMVLRQAVPPGIPTWQPALGVLVVLVSTIACVWVAGRIFRVGILLQGKGANIKEVMKWVVSG